ncbi:monocarboxylate transporter 10 isoform X3 [Myotis myotis]|uniref:monocarboxylate transporter 10 isoform X3 n=1 Tax=Myotis myotis TaxID=51298 RepID=UPI00174DBB3F|nr:monocarboxylate transporter 10 isoform X3 [Myotis myotis]XP_036172177.1 monocarboxylate transporter 10 isoform X3 [Myotis myotis]XP_036172178.1 monocarboxylate transporter 10 isoform X3 [Myotis myotis]XP_036172179.1 monocarboxylate transporter 10 isoform X3 [Myotis myotis]
MGKFSLHGDDFLLLPNSQHLHRHIWLSANSCCGCCYWIRWTHVQFFCKFHRTSVPHLRNHICQWLLLCVPAFLGHFGTLFQEAPRTGEWHCHRGQQSLHNFAASPFKGSDRKLGPLLHAENPLRLHVRALSGWLYLPTPCAQCQSEREWSQRRQQILPLFQEKVQSSQENCQFRHLQGDSLRSVGRWNPARAFGVLRALRSLDLNICCNLTTQVKHVNERFTEETNKEVVLMCIGITSGVGRLLFGRIADYVPGVKKVYLQVLSFVFIGLMSMMIPLCSVFGALIAVCLIMGLFDGCFISIMAPIAFELVGAQDVSQAIGFLLGFMSIPMTVGPPIAGLLREKLGSYDVAFYLAGVPPLIGGAILCFIPWIHSKKQREINKTTAGEKMEKMLENQNSLLSSSPGILKKESDSVI